MGDPFSCAHPQTLVAAQEARRNSKRPFSAGAECGEASVSLDFPG